MNYLNYERKNEMKFFKSSKKDIILILCLICVIFLITLIMASHDKAPSTADATPTKAPIPYATLEQKDPGMYVLKTYTSFDELVERGMFTLKDGRLETFINEESGDMNVRTTVDDIRGTFVFPAGVKTIGKYLFHNSSLQYTEIPDSVEHIETYAFSGCRIKELTIPDSVTTIGKCAFEYIPHIYYNGPATYSPDDKYWGARAMN